jgi:hypothetical protein
LGGTRYNYRGAWRILDVKEWKGEEMKNLSRNKYIKIVVRR